METTYNTSQVQPKMVVVTEDYLATILAALLPPIITKGIKEFKDEELLEKFLSPKETRKLFNPEISLVTLDAWAEKGYIRKYHIGGRTYYKYSEILQALKSLKKYQRQVA